MNLFFWRKRKDKINPLYTEGLNLMLAGEHASAMEKFRQIVKQDTENINAYNRLAELYRQTNRPKQALKIHLSLTIRTNLTDFQKVQVHRGLLEDWEALGKYHKALKIAEKLYSFQKNNLWTLKAQIRIYKKMNDWKSAHQILTQMLKIRHEDNKPLEALYLMQYGITLMQQAQYSAARKQFEHANHIDPNGAAPHLYSGNSYSRENNPEKAIEEWSKFAQKDPENAFLVFEKIEKTYFEMGQFGRIAQFYESVLRNDTDNVQATAGLADFYEKKGDTKSALDLVERTLELEPSSIRMRLLYSKLLNKIGEKPAVNQQIDNMLNIMSKTQVFICAECNFQSEDMLWLCPKCSAENSFHIQT
ncbi:MAG: tetratricopeptide repeat protein [Candidatus Marinimicrobia bacterium]|nr:tetratricopeptide repeat protein [Candidatus Neomarinimicrobiota bacterium]